MTAAVQPNHVSVPFFNIQFELSARDVKVLAVALASIAFFAFQYGLSWPVSFVVSFSIAALTYFSEKYIRTEADQQNDWISTDFNQNRLIFWSSLLVIRPLIIQVFCWCLGVPLPAFPQVALADAIISQPWKMIPMAMILAPIAEEVLFRGFLQERLEDIAHLLNRHTFVQLSKKTRDLFCDLIQSVVFGALHINNKIEEALKWPLLISLSAFGYFLSCLKRDKKTLVWPVAIHSANNAGAVIHVLRTCS
jgi:membrane protease YdiL (CAAX protease family)